MKRWIMLLAATALGSVGCQRTLNTDYGRPTGDSINGTRVFAGLLRSEGNQVGVSRSLTPSLFERADALILFLPESTSLSNEARDWLETWLSFDSERVVVLVPRDYDAEPEFWGDVLTTYSDTLDAKERERVTQAREKAVREQRSLGTDTIRRGPDDWFGLSANVKPQPRAAQKIVAGPAWTTEVGLEQGKLDLTFLRRLEAPPGWITLALAGQDPLIVSGTVEDGRVIVVANGSFLLNYSLVNPEHRKLATALARTIGASHRVVFVREPRVAEDDEPERGLLGLLMVPPIPWIAAHVIALGLVFAWSRAIIFGRPRDPVGREEYHFGRHVAAVGALLARSRRIDFARDRLNRYVNGAAGHSADQSPREPS